MGKIAPRCALACVALMSACALAGRNEAASEEVARQQSLDLGARALEVGDYAEASGRLAPIAAICPVDAVGRRAMLLLAAAELDPRNAARRPEAAAELAAFQLAHRRFAADWETALAAELYVLALDHGAAPIQAGSVPGPRVVWHRYLTEETLSGDSTVATPIGVAAGDNGVPDSAVNALAADLEATPAMAAPASGGPRCVVPAPDPHPALPELGREPRFVQTDGAPQQAEQLVGTPADVRTLTAEVERLRAELARKDQELERIRRTLRP